MWFQKALDRPTVPWYGCLQFASTNSAPKIAVEFFVRESQQIQCNWDQQAEDNQKN